MWYPLIIQCIVKDSASDAIAHAGHRFLKRSHNFIFKGLADVIITDITAGKEN